MLVMRVKMLAIGARDAGIVKGLWNTIARLDKDGARKIGHNDGVHPGYGAGSHGAPSRQVAPWVAISVATRS